MAKPKKPISEIIILTIDDDDITRSSLNEDLVAIGFTGKIYSTASPEEGLRILSKNKVDLILCDMVMPKMTGLEFLKEIKKYPSLANIAFAFLTSINDRAVVVESIKLGVDQFILKPWTRQSLLISLSGCLP